MRAWTFLALALALGPARAAAQSSDGSDLEQDARLRFELGERAYNRGEFAEAAEEFEEAYRLSNRPALLYNAYLAYRDGRQAREAAEALRRYLDAAGDVPNRARLEQTLRQLDADLEAGRTAPDPEPDRDSPPPPSGGGSVPIGPIVVVGSGAAVAIASIVTGVLALQRNDDLSAACPNDFCPSSDARAIQSDVETLSIATDVLWPLAIAALAAGAVWLAVDLSSGSGGERALRLGCGPLGCTAQLEGSFQ